MSVAPDLASLLAAHAAQQGPPQQQQDSQDSQGLGALRQILDLARQAHGSQQLDDQDRLLLEQATTLIQRILADVQKGQDGMLGGRMDPRAMRRATGGPGGSY